MELTNKEGLAHQLKFAALHQIREKRDKVRKQTKNHEKALINIQRIEEMLRNNNYNQVERKEKNEEIKRLYYSNVPDLVRDIR